MKGASKPSTWVALVILVLLCGGFLAAWQYWLESVAA